ncbi:HU family DNA-binding protein [Methylotetracoccus oryzae]|uniref:HU family DNA-binding protein n=1 Tax=Methylotetracoccus oryzae TaxID=1919059 RepID=UPI00111A1213|nr:HU family DNA-binding protein [Methylotetracoccus oryzae]
MNKSELIDAVVAKTGQTKKDTEQTLTALLDAITEAVAQGETVTFVGFGTFKPVERDAREGRNPATGETIMIAASRSPKFVPGKAFKEQVNGG